MQTCFLGWDGGIPTVGLASFHWKLALYPSHPSSDLKQSKKHRIDRCFLLWLELKNLFQTFQQQDQMEIEQQIKEIRALFDEGDLTL